jgi:uncharacterized protein YecE (DUF72 family)
MKFGRVDNPETIDFTLPEDHPDTEVVLNNSKINEPLSIHVGCAKWNRQELKNFYPRGTKDELAYYSTQFNSIELNATFYRIFPGEQFAKWKDKTPEYFRFFPKLSREISHLRRLNDKSYPILDRYLEAALNLEGRLGTFFLQMHNSFNPSNWDRVVSFVAYWPKNLPLAIEFRHTDWFANKEVSSKLYHLLEAKNIANVLVDTAGRRDLLHMRLTNNEAFIRYVGANHPTDYARLDDWVDRLELWVDKGLKKVHFFIHQNLELESPLLAAYFIKKINQRLATTLIIPKTLGENNQLTN